METNEIYYRLSDIFKKVFNNRNLVIQETMTSSDIEGWTSLTHMLLISEVEICFSIKFKLKDLNKMKNIGDMINMINLKMDNN